MVEERPNWRTGKICYIEIPAVDVARSAEFYHQAFGWKMRQGGDGSTSFDDTVGEVSGTFVLGRPPATEPGFGIYIMVADAEATLAAVQAAGGEIVRPVDPAAGEVFAWFKDPGGNTLGVYQQPGLAQTEAAADQQAQNNAPQDNTPQDSALQDSAPRGQRPRGQRPRPRHRGPRPHAGPSHPLVPPRSRDLAHPRTHLRGPHRHRRTRRGGRL